MRASLLFVFSSLLASALAAQDTAKAVFDKVTEAQRSLGANASREERAKAAQEVPKLAKAALEEHAKLLSEGEGLYWRGRLQMMARADRSEVVDSFRAYIEAEPAADLAQEARLFAAQMLQGTDSKAAAELLAAVKPDQLNEPMRRQFDSLTKNMRATETRQKLTGSPAPAIPALKVLGGPADWSLDQYKGKVVVLDFWATWCPPCRVIIPDLVKLQAARGKDGVQIVGVTRYYGYGMDFTEGASLPHGGKSVGDARDPAKKLSHEAEVEVNENFIKAFELNYPVVFTNDTVAGDDYGITGIPTVYVIGKDGKIVGHNVGGGPEAHGRLEKLVEQALSGKATTEAAAEKAGGAK